MAIRIINGKLWDGHRYFLQGETITGLSEKEEARLISLKVAEKVEAVTKVLEENKNTDNPYAEKNAKDMEKIIAGIEDIKELEALLAYEQQNKKRKTVLEAINARLDELDDYDDDEDDQDQGSSVDLKLNPDDMIVS